MSENRFGGHDEEAVAEDFEKAEEEFGGDLPPTVRIQDGMNVFWALPRVGDMPNFVEMVKMHYGPMHLCGRKGIRRDPENPDKKIDDTWFGNCYRCMNAWEHYEAAGKPGSGNPENQNPTKDRFKEDMPSDQGLVQVIDFTPFFTMKSGEPVPNAKMIEANLENYLEACQTGDEELIESLPEGLQDSAAAGVSVVAMNEKVSYSVRDVASDTVRKAKKHAKKDDAYKPCAKDGPALHPEGYLLWIDRQEDPSSTFTSRGQQRTGNVYKAKYLTPLELEATAWEENVDRGKLLDVAIEGAIDLRTPRPDVDNKFEEPTVENYARNFVPLSDDEIAEYLDASGHSFANKTNGAEQSDTSPNDSGSSDYDFSDPDAFEGADDVLADEDAQNEIDKARELQR